tara:strand:+ start:1702 stop:1965 length:264 start_codon:yes stop_codon:yes gene_type:complete
MAKTKKIDKEKIHNQLWFDLLDATEHAEELGVPHAVHMGIQFFTRMALDCAPNEVEALGIVMEAVKVTKSSDELDELEGGSDESVQS